MKANLAALDILQEGTDRALELQLGNVLDDSAEVTDGDVSDEALLIVKNSDRANLNTRKMREVNNEKAEKKKETFFSIIALKASRTVCDALT